MVQSKIKIEEYARYSRLGNSSISTNVTPVRVNSLVPASLASQRIHPVQRFSSEGKKELKYWTSVLILKFVPLIKIKFRRSITL